MTDRDLMQLALDALKIAEVDGNCCYEATELLRTRLAQPEQEHFHVATVGNWGKLEWVEGIFPSLGDKMYSTPPPRKPLPKGEWPKHPSLYVNDQYLGYPKSDLDDYAMQVLKIHGIKE